MSRRIAIVSDWFPPRPGGIEAQLGDLCERLADGGATVDVFTTTPRARDGRNYTVRGLDVLRLPVQQLAVSPGLVRRLRRELDRGCEVVHAHVSVVSPVGYAGALAARSLGLPVVVTFHSVLRMKAALLGAANSFGHLRDARVLWTAVSELVAGQVRRATRRADVRVLPNGVDLRFWSDAVTARPSTGPITLVSAMRLQRKKRPRELLRAYAHAVARTRTPARLVIIGDGPARAVLERDLAGYGLKAGPSRAELTGWLDRDAIRMRYGAAHGFVAGSTAESFGIAALEARAAGLPVIAMRGGSSEFLCDGADAILCDDYLALERAVQRFIDDAALRRDLSMATPDLARYDWRAVVAGHHAAYDAATRLAAGEPPASA